MWTAIMLTIIVFAIALLGMAVGVIFSNRCLRGSCGGTANKHEGDTSCDFCNSASKELKGESSGEESEESISRENPKLAD